MFGFLEQQPINVFLQDSGGPFQDLEMDYISCPEKAGQMFHCGCCLASEEVEAGLVADDVFSVRHWWVEERRLVLVCRLVTIVVVCQSVDSSSQTEDFQRSIKVLIYCVAFLCLELRQLIIGLKCFIGVKVNVSGLEGRLLVISN